MANLKAHQKYVTSSGETVPGATTVLNILNKPALIPWAWELGRQGIDLNKARTLAMDTGTCAHLMIAAYIKGEKPDLADFNKEMVDKAETAFLAFLEWEKQNGVKWIFSELQLVSDDLRYGGTIDAIAQHGDAFWLIDFKTSKGGACYPEYKYQVAAYRNLYESTKKTEIQQGIILCLDKETGIPTPHHIIDTIKEFEIFRHCLEIYWLQKR